MKKILALALFTLIGTADARVPLLDKVPGIGKVPVLGKMVVGKKAPTHVADALDAARYNQKSHLGKHYGKYMVAAALATTLVAGYLNKGNEWSAQTIRSTVPYLFNNGTSTIGSRAQTAWNKYGYNAAAKVAEAAEAKFGHEWDNTGTCVDLTYNNWMPKILLPFTNATLGGISRADYIAQKMAQLAIR